MTPVAKVIGNGGRIVAICQGELRSDKGLVLFLRFLILIDFGKNLGFFVRIGRRSRPRPDWSGHIEFRWRSSPAFPCHRGCARRNGVPVEFFGSTQCGYYACELHGVWDTDLIKAHWHS